MGRRSSSDGTDTTGQPNGSSPHSKSPSHKTSPSHSNQGGFHALSKIRQSLREKKPPLGKRAGTVEEVSSKKEVIQVLRKELLALQKEKETLSAMQPQLT